MPASWAFRSVLRSALEHIPDSMPSLKQLVDERINGFNYLDLDKCTVQEVAALLDALREGYKEKELAGPSSFGDPDAFAPYMEGFALLIRMIEEKLEGNDREDGSGRVRVNE
jgi:hypothetical protein